jgi:hypothetical protein
LLCPEENILSAETRISWPRPTHFSGYVSSAKEAVLLLQASVWESVIVQRVVFRAHLIFADSDRLAIDDQNFICADILRALSVGSPEFAVVIQVSVKHFAATHNNVNLGCYCSKPGHSKKTCLLRLRYEQPKPCSQVPDEN